MTPIQRIQPARDTTLAEDKDEARRIREQVILPALADGKPVRLDFSKVELATQSYIHALISAAFRQYGEQATRLIAFEHCTPEVQQLVLTVVEYTVLASDTSLPAAKANGHADELAHPHAV